MPDSVQEFESMRLSMLAEQYPDVSRIKGKLIFFVDGEYVQHAHWVFQNNLSNEDKLAPLIGSNFKAHLIELLHIFVQYRIQCNEELYQKGELHFKDKKIEIIWLPSSTENQI